MVKHQLAGMPIWQWFALLLLIPVAAGGGLGAAGAAANSVAVVGWETWGCGTGALAVGLRSSMASRRCPGSQIVQLLRVPLLPWHYYKQVTAVAVVVGTFWILWRVFRWFLQRVQRRAFALGHSGTGSLMLLGERMIKAVLFLIAMFLIFSVLGFDIDTALAGVGILTLAVGFGAQKSIENLFGGVFVLGDEVIRVGDVCKFGDRTGTVEDIGLRSTRVRTEDPTLLAIPNGTVATINIENLAGGTRHFQDSAGVALGYLGGPASPRATGKFAAFYPATTRLRKIRFACGLRSWRRLPLMWSLCATC